MSRLPFAVSPSGRRLVSLTLLTAVVLAALGGGSAGALTRAWLRPVPEAVPSPSTSPWRLEFRDDFSGTSLNANRWGAYKGVPNSGGMWLPSHVNVAGGLVTLQGYKDAKAGGQWVTGGIGNRRGLVQTYGRYRVRMRVDNAYGLAYAVLLWPKSNVAPPEVDFAEGFGRSMQRTKATVHSGTRDRRIKLGDTKAVDMTKWHTVGVEWTPSRLVFTLDDKAWWTVTGKQVPSVPMVLDIQSQIHDCSSAVWSCPDHTSPAHMNLYVDWVEAYSWSAAR